MTCKGICHRWKSKLARYSPGKVKKCRTCMIFLEFEGKFCPCCGFALSNRPRNRLHKEKFNERFNLPVNRISA